MIDRTTKLRWRRRFRRGKLQVEDLGQQAEKGIERHIFRRLGSFVDVRRFVASWVLLLVLLGGIAVVQIRSLSGYYQVTKPIPGGTYTEGILGSFTDANPLFATGAVDSAVSRLLFAGLMKYDSSNHLIGDLAQKWEVDDTGTHYTIKLKPNLFWHDNEPLTAEDVVFTYSTIQNPDTQSPLLNGWRGVKVTATDAQTVQFVLPSPLASFQYGLTNGIIPKHLLDGIPVSQLRSINFNSVHPIGAGPFQWEAVEVTGTTPEDREQRLALKPFGRYNGGQPLLSRFVIRSFRDEKRMITSFEKQELSAMSGIGAVPDELQRDTSVEDYNIPLTSAVMAFFKNSAPPLDDVKVRKALVLAANTNEILQGIGYPVLAVREPLLTGQLGFDRQLIQLGTDTKAAGAMLDEAGWKVGANGMRYKGKTPLTFKLYSQSSSEYAYVTQVLQRQWRTVGVDAQVLLQPPEDLQTTIAFHSYDALLYGISLGVDPDVFAFWHSSQADPRSASRLNFSEYKSTIADRALESGRTKLDSTLRVAKYHSFLDAWRNDAPALALYQPRYLYLSRGKVYGLDSRSLNGSPDRYANVQNWMIRETKTNAS